MRSFSYLIVAIGLGMPLAGQEVANTRQQANDWEEVNFETNQSVIVDGFPSLLRLADLLKTHPDYKVTITGHADRRGSNRLNDALATRRANAVSQFLQKYGAAASQIDARGEGARTPEDPANNRNAYFVNRRVNIVVTAPNGAQIGDGSITRAIEDFIAYARGQLGKIDSLSQQLGQIQNQTQQGLNGIKEDTAAIRQDTGAIRQDTGQIRQDTGTLVQRPVPLTADQTREIANAAGKQAADYALEESAKRNKKYSLIGFDVGPTFGPGRVGDYSADVFGKALIPFGNGKTQDQPGTHGFVVDGSWTYAHPNNRRINNLVTVSGVNDAIFNTGLVNRFGHVQIGAYAQFDYASLTLSQITGPVSTGTIVFSHGGTLLAGGVGTFDFVMQHATAGFFVAKGIKETGNINTTAITPLTTPAYLRYSDQGGLGVAGTFRKFQIEANAAWVKQHFAGFDAMPAVSAKVSFGPSDTMQFYVEGDANTTFANAFYPTHRIVIGLQFGNWVRARNYRDTQSVVPTQIPRPHYQMLTR
jgi:hypothetical protein